MFDGTVNNQDCVEAQAHTLGKLYIQNGYNKTLTLGGSLTVNNGGIMSSHATIIQSRAAASLILGGGWFTWKDGDINYLAGQ